MFIIQKNHIIFNRFKKTGEKLMYVFYQIGISIGMIVVAFAIHILRQAINGNSPFIMFNYLFALSISIGGIFIIVASLAAMQPQNWYTSSPLWKILIAN
ncbi:MAG: hypothetical protein LKF28_05150 [Lactobacillus amylovorus]|nr:hypothetical protein [Lactobacillus amylovorus]